METWDINQQRKESSFSIIKPGFCRLATLASCIEGMQQYNVHSLLVHTCKFYGNMNMSVQF